jgi:hypothetical protein
MDRSEETIIRSSRQREYFCSILNKFGLSGRVFIQNYSIPNVREILLKAAALLSGGDKTSRQTDGQKWRSYYTLFETTRIFLLILNKFRLSGRVFIQNYSVPNVREILLKAAALLFGGDKTGRQTDGQKWRSYFTLFETMRMRVQIKGKEVAHVRLVLSVCNSLVSVCERQYWADVTFSLLWAYLASVACFAGGNKKFLGETAVKYYSTP